MQPLSDARGDRPGELEPRDEAISPELVLVDPDLAARARALLPWPEPTLPPRREVQLVAEAPVEPAQVQPAEPAFQFARRLVAAATLVPMLVILALIAEFLGRSASPLGATTTSQSSTRAVGEADRLGALLAQRGRTLRSLVGLPGPPTSQTRSGGQCVLRWRREGLTLVFAARPPKNPCGEGRLVGGSATPSG